MPEYHVKISLPNINGIAGEAFGNNFNLRGPTEIDSVNVLGLRDAVALLYDGISGATGDSIMEYMSPEVLRGGIGRIRVYEVLDMSGEDPTGAPIQSATWVLSSAGQNTQAMPSEVAFKATLLAEGRDLQPVSAPPLVPGGKKRRPMQRFTGGLFFGPLNVNASTGVAQAPSRPTAAFMQTVRTQVQAFRNAIPANGLLLDLSVWSKSDAVFRDVEFVMTDDAWDTQRRRGPDPTGQVRLAVEV